MTIFISDKILTKLKNKHAVEEIEVYECFENFVGTFLTDTREEHQTDPKTQWFISQTNKNRLLKVVFIYKDGDFFIKTTYEPNKTEIEIYLKIGMQV